MIPFALFPVVDPGNKGPHQVLRTERFDSRHAGKKQVSMADTKSRNLAWLAAARNHPSVISLLWSGGL